MSDVPSPFKKYLKDYQKLEEKLLTCIYTKYLGADLTEDEQKQVDGIDKAVLAYDLCYLLNEGEEVELPSLKRRYAYGEHDFQTVEQKYKELIERFSHSQQRIW